MPSDGLDRDRIVVAAIALLDADGLDGLSMRKLGSHLGAGATSMYWHVGNKEGLVALAADAVFGEIDLPEPDDVGWREALTASARGTRAMILRHLWLVGVLGTHTEVHGPRIARFQDHTLRTCQAAGFDDGDSDRAAGTVFAFVLGSSLGEAAWATRPGVSPQTTGVVARARRWAEPYPQLLRRHDALAVADPVVVRDESFDFGLRAVLDGLAMRAPTDVAP